MTKKKKLFYVGINPIEIPALNGTFSRGDAVEGAAELLEELQRRSPLDWADKPFKESFRDSIVEKEKP